jgi:hypothetical protein
MLALLLAAALGPADPHPAARQPPVQCNYHWNIRPSARAPVAPSRGAPRSLASEPPADLHLLVWRRDANGCTVPVIVRYQVQGDGRFAPGR